MLNLGNFIIYLIMVGAVVGALSAIIKPHSDLGKEFVNGIHSIGPVFMAQAGIMVSIPFLSQGITYFLGPIFNSLGSDSSIAALSIIAVDIGGYQLANAIAETKEMWITASMVGYTSGATIVYLIPVGLMMLKQEDHKYLALGAMAGLISIPFAVIFGLFIITMFNIPIREVITTSGPALVHLKGSLFEIFKALIPLFIFCFSLAAGLKFKPNAMVVGFLIFGRILDAFIKMILALSIVEHFTGLFSKTIGWGFSPMFADSKDLFRAIEVAGYIGIMLAGTFPICYLFQKYCQPFMKFVGKIFGLSSTGAVGFITVLANIIATYHLFKNMNARDKVICVAFGICAQATIGDHLAFTANFQPTLILPVVFAKLFGGFIAILIAIKFCVKIAENYDNSKIT